MKTLAAILIGVIAPTAARAELPAIEEVWGGDKDPWFPRDMGTPCTWGSDCLESVCIITGLGGSCSRRCVSECPGDWSCVSVTTEDPGVLDYACVLYGLPGTLAPQGRPVAPDGVAEVELGASDDVAAPDIDVAEPTVESEPVMADAATESVFDVSEGGDSGASRQSTRPAPSGGCRAAPSVEPRWVYAAPFIWALRMTLWRLRNRRFNLARRAGSPT